jgi:hypothetical protein
VSVAGVQCAKGSSEEGEWSGSRMVKMKIVEGKDEGNEDLGISHQTETGLL